jgi:hypothetical protein
MANFSYMDKRNLEQFLQMGSGYVLDFSNRTFREFVFDSTGLDIDDETVSGSGSKAARLRYFWSHQPGHLVGTLLKDLADSALLPRVTDYRRSSVFVRDFFLARFCARACFTRFFSPGFR